MSTTSEPSTAEYPFQVGRVVYRTRQEAEAALAQAKEIYPEARPKIIDRQARHQEEVEYEERLRCIDNFLARRERRGLA